MRIQRLARPKDAGQYSAMLGKFAVQIGEYEDVDLKDGAIFTIGASHTGDMYDVDMAHWIVQRSVIVIWGVNAGTIEKAATMARFFGDKKNVMWTDLKPPEERLKRTQAKDLYALAKEQYDGTRYWVREGGATTIVTAYADRNPGKLASMAAPTIEVDGEDDNLDTVLINDLAAHGFDKDHKFLIVNYRESGHSGAGTAPALDTGQDGFLQLLGVAAGLGLTPVPMGEFDPYPRLKNDNAPIPRVADLLNYWTWPSVKDLGRRGEARLLRVLAENFPVVAAVGMRSGVTDLLAYVGFKTLSIDNHPLRGTVAKGWQRPLKREHAISRYKVVSLMQPRHRETEPGHAWPGPFGENDLKVITDAMTNLIKNDAKWRAAQHPQNIAGVGKAAGDMLAEVRLQLDGLRAAKAEPIPATSAESSSGRGPSGPKRARPDENLAALKAEIEEQKSRGVATSQMAAYVTRLRNLQEEIDALLDWLEDDFVDGSRERDDAYRDLKTAYRLVLDAKAEDL